MAKENKKKKGSVSIVEEIEHQLDELLSKKKGDIEKELEERVKGKINNWWNHENIDDIRETMHEFQRLAHLLKDNVRTADVKKLGRIRKAISRAYEEILKD